MNEFEKCPITNLGKLQEVGIDRPYPSEWDLVKYSRKLKAPMMQNFDDRGPPSQHIYYFQS